MLIGFDDATEQVRRVHALLAVGGCNLLGLKDGVLGLDGKIIVGHNLDAGYLIADAGICGTFTLTANCQLSNCQLVRAKVVFSKKLGRRMDELG